MNPKEIRECAKCANRVEAHELYLYALNTAESYHRFVEPTIHTLTRHAKRGEYDSARALIAWKRVADEMAKCYTADYGGEGARWYEIFTVADRCKAAIDLEDSERETVFYTIKSHNH